MVREVAARGKAANDGSPMLERKRREQEHPDEHVSLQAKSEIENIPAHAGG